MLTAMRSHLATTSVWGKAWNWLKSRIALLGGMFIQCSYPLVKFKLDYISALPAASLTDFMAPDASDKVDIFLGWFPGLLKFRLLRRNDKFALRKHEERRAHTNVDNKTLTQVFVKHPVLRFITPTSQGQFKWHLLPKSTCTYQL